jgi:predicted amidohydrolase YtcJ
MVSKPVTSRSIWRSASLISLAVACGSSTPTPQPQPQPPVQHVLAPADLVIVNADIFAPHHHKRAIAIKGSRIVAYDQEVDTYIGKATRVLDAGKRSIIVGLTDAHCHLYGLGADLDNVSVRNLASEVEVAKVIADAAKSRPPPRPKGGNEKDTGGEAEWLLGRGWDQNKWAGQQFPTKASLDAVVSDRPVMLRRIDGHAAWVNSKALAAAGITKATKDPAGGKIIRDAKGEPTGVFVDNAMDLIDAKIPSASPETRERRILAAAKIATELGFTGVHEMGIERETAEVYTKLAASGRLPLHVYAYLGGDPKTAEQLRTQHPAPATGRFVMRGVKYFADGALGSRGARLYDPYDDDKANRGLWVTEPLALTAAVDAAVAGGWDVAIHAIGDAGIGSVLDAYAAARAKSPNARLRVEHVQVIAKQDIPRMVATKAIASMQPTHATSDMPWAEARVGKERIRGAYAWRTMILEKIPLAFGSDFPVEEVNPLLGIHAAVTRTAPDGQPAGGWYPDQKLSLDEAVAAFTTGAAFAVGDDAPEAANITVFDGPLTPADLLKRKAVMTIVDGTIVFEAPGAVPAAAPGTFERKEPQGF